MTVNVISESAFTVKDQGVHTAFLNTVGLLKSRGIDVRTNSRQKADITHIHTVGPFSLMKLLSNKPTVVTAHIVPQSFVGSLVGDRYWNGTFGVYLRYFYNKADLVLAVAPLVKEQLEKLGVTTRIEIFPNPIDHTHFKKDKTLREEGRKLLGLSEQEKVIIGVGQVQPRKGIEDFIGVARALPDYTFLWIGGRTFGKMMAGAASIDKIIKSKPDNFHMAGTFEYKDMPKICNAADVFLFPSFQENAPMALIEAAATGLPLVLRDIKEYNLLYGENYLKGTDIQSFTQVVKDVLTDKKKYDEASKGSVILSNKFSYETLSDKLLGYYKSLL